MDWNEWLRGVDLRRMEDTGIVALLALIGLALVSSLLISLLYVKFYRSRATGSQVHRAFPLIGISVTAIFIAIQFSLPLSLGLLGALSIVRFRTPIKEPEEIGFILLVVASSLACATSNLLLLAVILIVAIVALLASRWRVLAQTDGDGMFIVTLPAADYREKGTELLATLDRLLPRGKLDSIAEGEQETVVSYGFSRLQRDAMQQVQDGVAGISKDATSNVFFHRGAP